jgi:hypothetical protein
MTRKSELIERAKKVRHLRIGRKSIVFPDGWDTCWGIHYSPGSGLDDGGVECISLKRAEKFIEKLERKIEKDRANAVKISL